MRLSMRGKGKSCAMAFDCDGVLVDSRRSYDDAILRVTDSLTWELAGCRLPWRKIGPPLVEVLRLTGGFNNDWDTTYALTILAGVAEEKRGRTEMVEELGRLVREVAKSRRPIGIRAVEKVVSKCGRERRSTAARLKDELGYPGAPPRSLLATRFDETYYGGALFREMYGRDSTFHDGPGLIERERVLIASDTLADLSEAFSGRVALVTGRTLLATRHTLGDLVDSFDLEASTFVGDASRDSGSGSEQSYSKPSPLGLVRAMDRFGADRLVYVGDSGEDILMAARAKRLGRRVDFIAVCGADRSKRSFFESHGAELTLASVNDLPRALDQFDLARGSRATPT